MARHRGRYRIVAGATDTLPWAREGRAGDVDIPVLIDVSQDPRAARTARVDDSRVRIGAATPIQRFLDDPSLARALPCMPRCAVWFADDQIRAQATIGGNIVNASPAADATPCLIAHDATVELASRDGGKIVRRRMPLRDFVTGPNKTALADGELLTGFDCDALPGYGGSFEKVGHRRSLVISLVCLRRSGQARCHRPQPRGRAARHRAASGRMPLRLAEVEKFLRGGRSARNVWSMRPRCRSTLVASRTRQEYRRDVVRGFMLRGLINAARRAGAERGSAHPRVGGGLCLISSSRRPSTAARSRAPPSRTSGCSISSATISI